MSNGSGKEVIKISPEVEGMQLGHPNFIGCYKKVVAKVGTEAALRLYDGMSEGKSAFICASDPRLDSFSVRWTLPRLKEIVEAGYLTRNQVLHRDMERNARYDDYYYDEWDRAEFYGPKDTVTYARWLYNRYGAGKVAKQFHVSPDFAEALGNSDLPGGIKVASLEGKVENIDAIEERIEDRHAAAFMNAEQLADFRKNGSRKLKVRMNRLMDHPEIYVLKKLLEAEEFSIAAKECIYKYRDYNYDKKSERLKEAIEKLPDTGWHYWWQRDEEGQAEYIFYVELPGEFQVSWHGMSVSDMEGVPETMYKEWDGQVASTLPKIVKCIGNVCPAILEEKFDRKKCSARLDEFFGK